MAKYEKTIKTERLAGDASLRTFIRHFRDGFGTMVEMVTPETHRQDFYNFIQTHKFLADHSIPVPYIIGRDEKRLRIYLEDLGDYDYFSVHNALPPNVQQDLYTNFTDTIIKIAALTSTFMHKYKGIKEILGYERLLWEMNFFFDNYLALFPLKKPSTDDLINLKDFLTYLARKVASLPIALCHRDFHSKNIMVRGSGLKIIDFQDLRLGPYNYDLASLLWDSYVTPSQDIISAMEERFFDALPKLGIRMRFVFYRRQNRFTALQRNIKAIGTFANQTLKGKESYLQFIAPTASKIREHISLLKIDDNIADILTRLFEE